MGTVDPLPGVPLSAEVALHQALEDKPKGVVMVVFDGDDLGYVLISSMTYERIAYAKVLLDRKLNELIDKR